MLHGGGKVWGAGLCTVGAKKGGCAGEWAEVMHEEGSLDKIQV